MLNDLPIDQLRSLVTISETNSFTAAAERLFRTQPALSLQIKKLEERVGTALLERNGRTIGVTEAGSVLVDYARRILELNEEAVARLSVTETEGIVRVGVLEEVAIGPLMQGGLRAMRFLERAYARAVERTLARRGDAARTPPAH